jgi:hypothetical protein
MLIPLGSSCKVRESIQRYLNINSMQTNMFDWVFSNFESILYFISNIDVPVKADDFYDTNHISIDSRVVFHKNLRFDTLHDFDASKTYEDEMPSFLDKYNRRLQRLKELILSNEKLDFIHLVDINYNHRNPNQNMYIPSIEQVYYFYQNVKKINPNCNFNLHILIPPPYCKQYKAKDNKTFSIDQNEINKLKITHNIFIHYLSQNENIDSVDEQCQHWSWFDVYNSICNN